MISGDQKMSGEQKREIFNLIFKGAMLIIGSLITVIFYSFKDKVESIDTNVVTIRIQMQRVEDRVDTHSDAINELKRGQDYLQKSKKDK